MFAYVSTIWQSLLGLLPEFFGGMTGVLVGWLWGRWQASRSWKQKSFTRSVVLGLNAIENHPAPAPGQPVSTLRLRTVFEQPLETLFPHLSMQSVVSAAMDKTTKDDPLLRFPKEDSWYILNAILNQIATQFADGAIREQLGYSVKKSWFVFCMTFERDDRMHQFKTRVMLMQRDAFLQFPESGAVNVERETHQYRVETLRFLRKEYDKNPHLFMAVELTL